MPAASDPVVELVRRQVGQLAPADARMRRSQRRFLAELERLPEPFLQDADPVHVTGSAIVVGPAGVLLHRHKRLGVWLQPGGHVDPGETPWDAAVREVREETGLRARHEGGDPCLVHVDVHRGGRGHTHLDLRYLLVAAGRPRPPPAESQEVRWFGWHEALAVADPGLLGALQLLPVRRSSPR